MTPITYLPTLATFVARYGIRLSYIPCPTNNRFVGALPADARHWLVTLWRGAREVTFPFTMTPDHGDEPDVLLVVGALAYECRMWEARQESSEEVEDAVARSGLEQQAARAKELLDESVYEELLYLVRG
jgi:hypothetical protein